MSHPYYTKIWADTTKNIGDVLRQDQEVQVKSPFKRRKPALRTVADLYVRYLKLVKNLDICYDQVTQPQKRPLIRRLLDMSIARMLEMRNLLQQLDLSDYSYFMNVLIEHRMTPFDMELPAPRYFCFGEPRENDIKMLKDRIDYVLEHIDEDVWDTAETKKSHLYVQKDKEKEKEKGEPKKEKSVVVIATAPQKSLAEVAREKQAEIERVQQLERMGVDAATGQFTLRGSIRLLQRHERARQGRFQFGVQKMRFAEHRRLLMGLKPVKKDMKKLYAAATVIQKVWRGYRARQKLKSRDVRLLLTLGLAMPNYYSDVQKKIADEVCAMRRKMQAANNKNYEDELARETERYMKRKVPWLREDMTDQIREWFVEWYVKVAMFPTYPTEEEGGGMAIVEKQLVSPEKYLQKMERLKREKEQIKFGNKKKPDPELDKAQLKALKKKEKAAKKKAAKERRRKIKQGERLIPWSLPETDVFPEMMEAYGEYKDFWRGRDETDDALQRLEMDLLRAKVAGECTRRVRLEVDEFMKIELQVLHEAVLRDKGKKVKKPKKGKKGKKKKGKKVKILTEEEVLEMFDELVKNGIIKKTPPTYLKDFRGDFSYLSEELRNALTTPDPLPCLGDIRQAVMETCILPLGCRMAHNYLPLIRSVCFAGMPKSGTTMLAHAVCTETGSLVFDFSPAAICNSPYTDAAGIKRFVKIVGEVARYFQPSIFLIDGAEKPFYKKVPREERDMKPKIAAKHLKKILKTIKQEDQILILGATSQPLAAKGGIKKIFEKWIFLPVPNNSTVVMTWNEELMKHYLVDRTFITTPLTAETMNYNLEDIIFSANDQLDLKRRIRLKMDPLTQQELLGHMFNYEQYAEKAKKKLIKWYNKTDATVKYKNKVLANERIDAGLDPPRPKKR